MHRLSLIAICAIILANCATGAQTGSMIPTVEAQLPANSPLANAMIVSNVSGGQNTNPLWTSEVGNAEFQAALQQTLAAEGMIAAGPARYSVDAMLMEVDQPMIGFSYTVGTTVRYTVREIGTGNVIFDETIAEDYTAEMSEAFLGMERLRLANEGSVRNNIAAFVRQLIENAGQGGTPLSALRIGGVS